METTTRLVTIAAATASALVYWTLTDGIGGVDLAIRQGGETQPIGPVSVAATTLIVGFLAWALLALLERRAQHPARTWRIIALAVFVVSLAGPLGSGADLSSKLILTGMHMLIALILIPNLPKSGRPQAVMTRTPAS
ncbi:hypothetical protein HH310_12815 [Actinoplanes sp. TBRC 11911]|uniref:DUF6069 family protein n=1 Tax=Actinoplanes sp. TBRC 11911 TaxID=2729386 RepID=UPI00145F23C9|nr:DUF6069 family protein [Actinoplanes sp. TBRC 11911]NMO52076.1 hypothetical protein [Actinoplanes sp. TBRC 11911]